MKYTVQISQQAEEELAAALRWLAERTEHAIAWHGRVLKAIDSLEQFPERCSLAPENQRSSEEIRHLIVGDRLHAYRIVFTIRGESVFIIDIVHGARDVS